MDRFTHVLIQIACFAVIYLTWRVSRYLDAQQQKPKVPPGGSIFREDDELWGRTEEDP